MTPYENLRQDILELRTRIREAADVVQGYKTHTANERAIQLGILTLVQSVERQLTDILETNHGD